MRPGVLAALALAALVAGCGAEPEGGAPAEPGPAATAEEILPAPPLEAVDEPVPARAVTSSLPLDVLVSDCGPDAADPEISEEDCRSMLEAMRAEERGLEPAPGETPRAVARLRLADGSAATFVEYTSRAGKTCGAVLGEGIGGGPTTGGFPCGGESHLFCRKLCLLPAVVSDSAGLVLAGTVAAAADGIRLRFEDGSSARYPLTGPLSRLDPGRRIFMVEVPDPLPTQELLEGETVVERFDLENPDVGDVSGTPGVEVELDGQTLHVEIGPDAPPQAQALLTDDEVVFLCYAFDEPDEFPDDPYGLPPSHTFGRFPAGERAVTVELRAPVAGKPLACVVHSDPGADDTDVPDVFRLLVSPEELSELGEDG